MKNGKGKEEIMGNNVYKLLGTIFMLMSGGFYTAERITEKISAAIVAYGYASTGMGTDRSVSTHPFLKISSFGFSSSLVLFY